jgi:tRNA nucleotidyltransferase (CCA-adding enzyme)
MTATTLGHSDALPQTGGSDPSLQESDCVRVRQLPRFRELDPVTRTALEAARVAATPAPIYAVGGYVRDLLLGLRSMDIDLVVEGDAIAVARRVGDFLKVAVTAHPRFGTARLRLSDEINLDLASARTEQYPQSAALPEVRPAPLLADLARRDFGINAMAARVGRRRFGPLIDPLGGCEDLRRGRIRVLHERSLIDDPTRIFRAARFEARYRFVIARGTVRLIEAAVGGGVIGQLAGSRIFTELLLIGEEPPAPRVFRRLSELGVLAAVHPKLAELDEAFGLFDRLRRVLARSSSLPLLESPALGEVYLLGMLYHLHPRTVVGVIRRLNPPGRSAEKLVADLEACRWTVRRLCRATDLRQSRIGRLLDPLSPEARGLVLASLNRGPKRKAVSEYLTASREIAPLLKGEDLRGLGFRPGPIFRKIFAALRSGRLDGRLRTRQDEISFVRRRFARTGLQD